MDLLEETNVVLAESVDLLAEKKKGKGKLSTKKISGGRYKLDPAGLKGKWRNVAHHNVFIVDPENKALFLPGSDIDPNDVKSNRSLGTKIKGVIGAIRKLNVNIGKKKE